MMTCACAMKICKMYRKKWCITAVWDLVKLFLLRSLSCEINGLSFNLFCMRRMGWYKVTKQWWKPSDKNRVGQDVACSLSCAAEELQSPPRPLFSKSRMQRRIVQLFLRYFNGFSLSQVYLQLWGTFIFIKWAHPSLTQTPGELWWNISGLCVLTGSINHLSPKLKNTFNACWYYFMKGIKHLSDLLRKVHTVLSSL